MTPEPPGTNCVFGGVTLRVGVGPASYLCSGAPSGVTLPALLTVGVTGVRYVDALVNATVTSDGGEFILLRGVILATHPAPTIQDTVYFFSGMGAGTFVTRCDGLAPATTYYVRAFATNALGTSYGAELSFTTNALTVPTLTTQTVSSITNSTAVAGGNITDDGGTPILGRGICWALAPSPTTASACSSEGVGSGSFISLATGLTSATTYHLRAYATNAQGTSYGNDLSFTTVVPPLATVTTAAPIAISYTTATGGGTVVFDSGSPVTSRGICWATSVAPTTPGTCYTEAGGLGTFAGSMTGLAANTTYHLRAFALNGGGTSYGADLTFTTLTPSLPSLSTKAISGISSNIAGSGGVIATDGGSAITAKGVCWSLNPTPTVANTQTADGTGPASFNSTLTGLNPLTTYYVRAYATNALGTAYGSEFSFATTALATPGPTVPVTASYYTATSGGTITDDGGCAITQKGVAWSWTPNPTTANPATTEGAGTAAFVSSVTGIYANRTYYLQAYATNSVGTSYGPQVVFTTLTPSTLYLGQNYAGGIVFYVDATGLHGLVSALVDQGTAPYGCQGKLIGTSTAIGTGATNTAAIIASCAEAGIAARIANGLVLNGYADWFLPSKDELGLMITNLATQGLGGLASNYAYMSSSEYDANYCYVGYYSYSASYGLSASSKQYAFQVRPVRAF